MLRLPFLMALVVLLFMPTFAPAQLGLPNFLVEPAFPNLAFTRPVYLTALPDGSNRLAVVEQYTARIMVFANNPVASASSVYLNLSGVVRQAAGNEEGLLGLAFHPDFVNNGYFYVYYTGDGARRSVVARYTQSATTQLGDPNSAFILLEIPQPASNHNGGCMQFGPDGMLYISLGDGGGSGDPNGNGQNLTTMLGSILRIDVDHMDAGKNYAVPPDNPFVSSATAAKEIFAWGLRNTWRYSWDFTTGRLWAADVGQGDYEEIDIIEPGRNYGWNIMEASHCYPPSVTDCSDAGLTYPIWEYGRGLGGSVTGGYVYRGIRVPELAGLYVFADYSSGRIWALRYEDGLAATQQLIDTPYNVSSFGIDSASELYFTTLYNGHVFRLVYETTPQNDPPQWTLPGMLGLQDTPPLQEDVLYLPDYVQDDRTATPNLMFELLAAGDSAVATAELDGLWLDVNVIASGTTEARLRATDTDGASSEATQPIEVFGPVEVERRYWPAFK